MPHIGVDGNQLWADLTVATYNLVRMAREGQDPLSGRLRLGVIPTIGPFLLPRILPRLRLEFPELQVFIKEEKTDQLIAGLADGSLDLILIALPYAIRNAEVKPLFKDHFHLACRKDTRLIDPQRFSVNRATADIVLLLEDGHCLRDHALDACRIRKLETINRFSASSLFTLLEMVDADLGVTFLPEIAIGSSLLKQTGIQTFPMPRNSYREIGLAWRKSSAHAEEYARLGRLIKRYRRKV